LNHKNFTSLILVELPRREIARGAADGHALRRALAASLCLHFALGGIIVFQALYLNPNSRFAEHRATDFQVSFSTAPPPSVASLSESGASPPETIENRPEHHRIEPRQMETPAIPVIANRAPSYEIKLNTGKESIPPETVLLAFEQSVSFDKRPGTKQDAAPTAATESSTSGDDSRSPDSENSRGEKQRSTGAVLLKKIAPRYPDKARQKEQEGLVILLATISDTGKIGSLTVARSSGVTSLDQAALKAVRQWKFSPAEKDNQPVSSRVRIPISFRLVSSSN